MGLPERGNFYHLYYLRRSGRWPIGNTGGGSSGGRLIASKRQLLAYIDNLTRGPPLGKNRIVSKVRLGRRAKKAATRPNRHGKRTSGARAENTS